MTGSSLEAAVTRAIWDELERQADRFGCVDRDTGLVDSGVDMDKVAAAVIEALALTDEWSYVTESDVIDGALFPDESEITDDRRWAEQKVAERCQSCDRCRNAEPKRLIQRRVSPWVAVDGSGS